MKGFLSVQKMQKEHSLFLFVILKKKMSWKVCLRSSSDVDFIFILLSAFEQSKNASLLTAALCII